MPPGIITERDVAVSVSEWISLRWVRSLMLPPKSGVPPECHLLID